MIVRFADEPKPNAKALQKVRALQSYLEERPLAGMIETVPAFHSLTLYYDPLTVRMHMNDQATSSEYVKERLREIVSSLHERSLPPPRRVDIPVCYGGSFGPDIAAVAEHNGLHADDVIHIHSSGEYTVFMLGFAPGFPYLGGMDQRLAMPRKATPRLRIPAGSVAIAGEQTGIYPLESPGGWNLIGRTPLTLFNQRSDPPTLLKAGAIVRFHPITESEFSQMEGRECP